MTIGIGSDIVEHALTEILKWTSDPKLLKRIFSTEEIELYNNHKKITFIAGRFAVKEAVLKCLGTGMYDGIALTDIQVLQSNNGKPILKLDGEVKVISDKLGITMWHITITHSVNYSLAFVIAEGNNS